MRAELKPIQAGGMCHVWQSPDGRFRHVFVKLDLTCEGDPYPGILITTDRGNMNATALEVKDMRVELPKMIAASPEGTQMYWRIHQEVDERKAILAGLTSHPTFFG